jgi:two-component system cell cycle sensor histidine kinase/response regulator CckA
MIYLDLIINLALLVALSVVSGFIDKRWPRHTRLGILLQGFLFGGASVIGMLRPLNLGPGLIFDGRSVMVSLCALFFWSLGGVCGSYDDDSVPATSAKLGGGGA